MTFHSGFIHIKDECPAGCLSFLPGAMNYLNEKWCRKCFKSKPYAAFGYRHKGLSTERLQHWCTACRTEANRIRRKKVMREQYIYAFPNDKNNAKRSYKFMLAKLKRFKKRYAKMDVNAQFISGYAICSSRSVHPTACTVTVSTE